MEEKNKNKLKEALADLPKHEPEAFLWDKIESFLDFEAGLQKELPKMQLHEPEDSLWDKIEMQLDDEFRKKETMHFYLDTHYWNYSAAAASLLLLLASVFVLIKHPQKQAQDKVSIAYSEEVVMKEKTPSAEIPDDTKGILFIKEHCSRNPEICAKPEFRELQFQLDQLEEENKKLKQQIEVFGEDPVLIRNQIKIQNLKSEFTKELIQIIIS